MGNQLREKEDEMEEMSRGFQNQGEQIMEMQGVEIRLKEHY